jgi:hypothetical protein
MQFSFSFLLIQYIVTAWFRSATALLEALEQRAGLESPSAETVTLCHALCRKRYGRNTLYKHIRIFPQAYERHKYAENII